MTQVSSWLDELLEQFACVLLSITPDNGLQLLEAFSEERAQCVSVGEGGVCPFTGAPLQTFKLTPEERDTVREGLLNIAGKQGEMQRQGLHNFTTWFRHRFSKVLFICLSAVKLPVH